MMVVFQILGLLIWLLAVPVGLGLLFRKLLKKAELPDDMRTFGITLLVGYIVLFTLLELVGIPVMLLSVYHGYSRFVLLYVLVLGGGSVAGYLLYLKGRRTERISVDGAVRTVKSHENGMHSGRLLKKPFDTWEGRGFLLLFLLLVGFQLYMSFAKASFDGDDAYYVVQSLTAQQIDTLYRIDPNNGMSTPLDARHALALFPIWEAFIGTVCGVHATIVAHSIVPLVLIPLTYLVYYEIGKKLFIQKKSHLPVYMALMALWQLFGNVSIYTNETFLLTRTWQGKSFAGNFVLPAVLWIFLCLFRYGEDEAEAEGNAEVICQKNEGCRTGLWLLLALLNLAAGASSSLAVLLSCALTAGLGFLLMIKERRFINLFCAGLSCVSGGAYVLLYLLL